MMRPITLTFDNGPDPEVTPGVLDTLRRHGISATFFVVGNRLADARAVSERAHDEGHWIGNHTWSHSLPFRERSDDAFVRAEIDDTQAVIGDLAHPDRLFRPYGGQGRLDGALTSNAAAHLEKGGFTCVLWNAVPGDFKDYDGWPATALAQVEPLAWPLVVLHDVHAAAMRHLDRFLGTLKDRGFSFEQAFPPDCVAIARGRATGVLGSGVVSDEGRPEKTE
ncbi:MULTISPECIES: polysaccharide deacetylase family protein [unclassified Chelatococcus]|uniref:polysaccharide deacetylase family protein n=1 Tax=unclassified Chelatococcus TaxID=2638111 RepID=UPI001BD13E0F|nr:MULTISPECIES: polysaccharide deacetylase family protein [unclassified Chelatococcus]MBS7700310.1 polysaccharide deacetylase family protein [Chelatococcus sp. YT9]MBX3556106.1 polysaccharide deacetylase family protein [Chelatococcus sp.]